LSKDLFDDVYKENIEPDAEFLYNLRNLLEHRFLKLVKFKHYQSDIKNNGSKLSNLDYFLQNFVNNTDDDNIVCAYLYVKNAEFPSSFILLMNIIMLYQ
jgi:hypothetical protein